MSRSYRELKATVSLLQKLCSEQDSRLQQARADVRYFKAHLEIEQARRNTAEDRLLERSRTLSDFINENQWLKSELKQFGYRFPINCLSDDRNQIRMDAAQVRAEQNKKNDCRRESRG